MHEYLPTRKQIRLSDYDYSLPGFYYVTIVTYKHQHFFGQVVGVAQCGHPLETSCGHPLTNKPNQANIEFNHAGIMINDWWKKIPEQFNNVLIHDFIVMPNHLHGIIEIVEKSEKKLSDIVHWLKTKTTNDYIKGVHAKFWPEYEKQFWQKSYHDHIIRGQEDMRRIQEYIQNNPINWAQDEFYK